MSRVMLKSVQPRSVLEEIQQGIYKPSFTKSLGSTDSLCRDSYYVMLESLSLKTGRPYVKGVDTCIWSWYQNPFYLNQLGIGVDVNDLVIITFEVDESEVIFSDFDTWCDIFISGESKGNCFYSLEDIPVDACVQATSWGIPKGSIVEVDDFVKRSSKGKFMVSNFIDMYNELKKATE